ncbi:hypothetical protein [Paraburkholderia domus]|uniref:DNA-binding protein n=1 Tax=Paraburkholderia domus TaxID=2793075 RepID=A0A9N8R2N0_9BURK|nr:hypothetical protein [Paraburkholderia domus]MBK5162779.1 hypothetical protein [Burkholderia sp. R-70211]CAE6958872.1 hypothetical protein R70211_06789 [Paraburkholderia domus]
MDQSLTELAEAVFTDTDAALRFALRFASQQHSSSELAGLRGPSRSGKGLSGMDGAAQAGMVRAELAKLTLTQRALLIGRYALPDIICTCGRPCCCGHRPNPEWSEAISQLARETTLLFAGRLTYFRLRQTLIGNLLLGLRVTDRSLAAEFGVHRQTVAEHGAKLEAAILGTRHQAGDFDRALGRIDLLLHEAGIVRSEIQ